MKNLTLKGLLLIIASSFFFIQCTTDPIPGPEGMAGMDGIDGVDGVDGTTSCVACHSDTHRDPIIDAYALSKHSDQTIMYNGQTVAEYTNRGGGAGCAKCHVEQGYIDYITNGKIAADPYTIANGVSCTTCHGNHGTFDFENDGQDFALRNIDPVMLDETDVTYTIDYGDASNSCVTCHQPRSKAPIDADNDGLYLQANSRFYPHYGGQSTMLEGIQGAIIANGSTAYPAVGSAAHRTGASCTSCHMNSTDDAQTGGHTFAAGFSSSACTTCHASSVPTEVSGLAADMTTLHNQLFDLGLIAEDGSTIVQTEMIPFKSAQALWNYKTVEEDGSHGVHNPEYAKALVKNAIEALQ
jgi:hypothetical protein